MSVWETLRTKRLWIAVGISAAALLMLWAVGALLIEKGTVPPKMQNEWIAGSCIVAGITGGYLISRKRKGGVTAALIMAAVLIGLGLIITWTVFGGVSFKEGGWKNMLFLLAGSLLAGLITAGRGGNGRRKKGNTTRKKVYRRR